MRMFNIATAKKSLYAAPVLAAILFASCSDLFQERVPMQTATNGTTLATLFNADKVIEKLDAPAQVFVSNGEYNDTIILNWEAVEGAASYTVERAISGEKDEQGNWKVPDEGSYEFLEHSKFIEGTSYTDTVIDNSPSNSLDYSNEAYSCAYFYRVSAENAIKNYEASDYTYTTAGTLLTPPSNVKASCGSSKTNIKLSWTRAPGSIASYIIYRSTNSDGSGGSEVGKVYGNAEETSIGISSENQGTFFYFTVVSVSASSGQASVASSVAMGYTLKEGAPSQPQNVEVVEGRGQTKSNIKVTWQASSGNDIKYSVYRYSNLDSTLKQLTSSTGTDQTEWDDTSSSLKPNVFYYYQVQAWTTKNDERLNSQMSDSGDDGENPAEGYLISPPQSVAVQRISGNSSNNKIVFSAAIGSADCVSNTAITDSKKDYNSYSYLIYASDNAASFSDSPIETVVNPTASDEAGYYQVTVPAYKFYKMATRFASVISAQTAAIAPAPNAAQNLSVSKNAAIDGYTNVASGTGTARVEPQANANGVHAIKLTWQVPVGGADGGYHIYRSTKPDSGFKKITENPVTDLFYIYKDEQAKAGTYYYYRVLSLNSLGQGANYSNTDYGYGALTTYQYVREYIKTTLNSQKKLTLMHKSGNTDKLGSESASGAISGTLSYEAKISGVSGRVIMHYTNYADFYIMSDSSLGVYFLLNGNTNTSAGIDTNGTMDGTVTVEGMYPGSVVYDAIKIKGGAAGGGSYGVTRAGIDSAAVAADWTWGEK